MGDDRSDDLLVAEARDGNVRAFEALLDRHQSRVLRVLRLMGVPSSDREDVAQEVFIRVFRHLDGFRPGRPFSGWIYRVTVNASYDYHLRVSRRSRDEVSWEEAGSEPADVRPGAERNAAARDVRERLVLALESLSERERAVFVLKEIEGLDTSEVSSALGISGITVRRHLGRARERLLRLLAD